MIEYQNELPRNVGGKVSDFRREPPLRTTVFICRGRVPVCLEGGGKGASSHGQKEA